MQGFQHPANISILNWMPSTPLVARRSLLKWLNTEMYRKTVQNRVILSVTQSYYDFVVAKKQVELLEDQLSTQLKLQELQKLQFESGQVPLNSVLNTLDATATTQLALIKAQASVKLLELKLKNDIGWDKDIDNRQSTIDNGLIDNRQFP